ncbi:MAG: hypothetical protein P8X70_01675 [Nanoarchaeota archaeon]
MGLNKKIKVSPPGGYTSYFRTMYGQSPVDMEEIEGENLNKLGISKLNPAYILEVIYRKIIEPIQEYFEKREHS